MPAATVKALGDLGKDTRRISGELIERLVRLEIVGFGPELLQHDQHTGIRAAVRIELLNLRDCVGEVRADANAIEIADDQEWPFTEFVLIAQQLHVGIVQILALALVLPGEVALHPHIGPAVAACGDVGSTLEGVALAGVVDISGLGDIQQIAQIVEVGLGCGAFLEVGCTDPFALKTDDIHAG